MLSTDAQFQGLGHAFVNTWSTLIVIKHAVVIVLVGIGVYIDLLVVPDIERPVDATFQVAAVRRLARSATAIAALGTVVLLLTAAAQAS
jgi:putative copper export protein